MAVWCICHVHDVSASKNFGSNAWNASQTQNSPLRGSDMLCLTRKHLFLVPRSTKHHSLSCIHQTATSGGCLKQVKKGQRLTEVSAVNTAPIFSLCILCMHCENVVVYQKSISECFILKSSRVHIIKQRRNRYYEYNGISWCE